VGISSLQLSTFFHEGWLTSIPIMLVRIPRTIRKHRTLFGPAGGQSQARELNFAIHIP
jgi:hypothetical protein